jgi:hypothetical protein
MPARCLPSYGGAVGDQGSRFIKVVAWAPDLTVECVETSLVLPADGFSEQLDKEVNIFFSMR